MTHRPRSTLFPYTTLFRSSRKGTTLEQWKDEIEGKMREVLRLPRIIRIDSRQAKHLRSEEHTSELQSHVKLVCRLLLHKKILTIKVLHCIPTYFLYNLI